jgi:hypothetical protein
MNDLNKKLGLGPIAPKKEEVQPEAEEAKAPLADARKGRAKGPQRRKPGVSPSGAAEEEKKVSKPMAVRFAISRPMTIWEVDESGELSMGSKSVDATSPKAEEPVKAPSAEAEAPSSPEKTTTTSTDSAVQTGELDIKMMTDTATGTHEDKTVYLGGRAPEPGSVVVDADGTQHVGSPDSLGSIEKTGMGM